MFLSIEEVREGLDFPDLENETEDIIHQVDIFIDKYDDFIVEDKNFYAIIDKIDKLKKEQERGSFGSFGMARSTSDNDTIQKVQGLIIHKQMYEEIT